MFWNILFRGFPRVILGLQWFLVQSQPQHDELDRSLADCGQAQPAVQGGSGRGLEERASPRANWEELGHRILLQRELLPAGCGECPRGGPVGLWPKAGQHEKLLKPLKFPCLQRKTEQLPTLQPWTHQKRAAKKSSRQLQWRGAAEHAGHVVLEEGGFRKMRDP